MLPDPPESSLSETALDATIEVDPGEVDPGEVDPGEVDPGEVDPGEDTDDTGAAELISADELKDVTFVGDAPEMVEEEEPVYEPIDNHSDTLVSSSGAGRVALIKRDPVTAYVQETKRYRLLTREEEKELAERYVTYGDTDAARKLIESNLRLVVKIAYEYRRAQGNLLDLIQEGNIGLMKAVKKYDPSRGVKLSSYAAWWIRAYMLRFILNNTRMVKVGTTQAQRKLFFNLRKERDRLEQLGFTPTHKQLAESLDVKESEVVEMDQRLSLPDASMDAPFGMGDGGTRTRYDVVESEMDRPDVAAEASEFQQKLSTTLESFAATLSGREETIFRKRWLTDDPMTLQALGDIFGVSRERARQLEKRLLKRVKTHLEETLGSSVAIDALIKDR